MSIITPRALSVSVHEELGVEELEDLAHVSRADLKDTRGLKPVT